MTDTAEHVRSSPTPPERRQHPRQKINDISYIVFPEGVNGGIVLNISETGLLLQVALPVTNERVSRLRFQLPSSDEWIEARAKLVWVSESGTEAGARFLKLPEGAQAKIKNWIGNLDTPRSPASALAEQLVPQQTTQQAPTSAPAAVSDPSHSAAATGSAARLERETMFPLWGLRRVLCWVAVAVAVLLGLRYSSQISRLPILGSSKEARNILASVAKTVRSLYANAVTSSANAPVQSQSSKPSLKALAGGPVPPASIGRQSSQPTSPNKNAGSVFGAMVTQTLSPGPNAPERNATTVRSQASVQRRAQRDPQTRNAPFATHTDSPDLPHSGELVAAPAIGAPPARVTVEREAVSASSLVAITESRSILVPGSLARIEKLQLGKLVSEVEPTYPAAALAMDAEGIVRVRAIIGRSGDVLRVELLSGPATLATAAVNAIRKWRYGPTLLSGQAIESQADITVFFRPH